MLKKYILIFLILCILAILMTSCIKVIPEQPKGIVYQKTFVPGEKTRENYTLDQHLLLILTEDNEFVWIHIKKKVWNNYQVGDIFPKPITFK